LAFKSESARSLGVIARDVRSYNFFVHLVSLVTYYSVTNSIVPFFPFQGYVVGAMSLML
jgi:hypothetical protein